MHVVAVLALHGVIPFDLGTATLVFGAVDHFGNCAGYDVIVCGEARRVRSRPFDVQVPYGPEALQRAHTIVIPGIDDPTRQIPEPILRALVTAWNRGARLASICTGSFVLVATGLLDGRCATTHWRAVKEFVEHYPGICIDPNVLFVDEGGIVTSAGAAAGLDMCLHLVRRDHGQAVAAKVACLAVAPLDRDGGQAQFIRREPPRTRASLAPLLEWMEANCAQPLDVGTLANRARLSPRTFARRFREQTGTTPLQWLLAARLKRAQQLLETSSATVEEVAAQAGFDSATTFRARFTRVLGLGPAAYRRQFNAAGSPRAGRRSSMTDPVDATLAG